ncbi:DUF1631 family protein [Aquabacterium sp.]|uniref:DUF1631 family protein n=1 Tax=Aquabacterium sp. TaxID=1872578 RepID=UPI003B705CC4
MTDHRLETVLQAAVGRIKVTVSSTLDKLATQLGPLALSATNNAQRQVLNEADRVLRLKGSAIKSSFDRAIESQVTRGGRNSQQGTLSNGPDATDWASLSLVDNDEVERGVMADRMARTVLADCDSAFEAVGSFIASLVGDASPDRNPLRPQKITRALLDAMAEAGCDEESLQVLAGQLARTLGPELDACYKQLAADMRTQGVQPLAMTLQRTAAPNNSMFAGLSGTSAAGTTNSEQGELGASSTRSGAFGETQSGRTTSSAPPEAHLRAAQALGEMFGVSMPNTTSGAQSGLAPLGWAPRTSGAPLPPVSADFQNLLRQITQQAGPSGWDTLAAAGYSTPGIGFPDASAADAAGTAGFAGPLMAANLIRVHRDELIKASGGAAIDQMVIDIVAALFDQVLSDPKVAPQMARQIARLQMPVLRVALGDMTFFNSRKHPVRRFVNRMATLSASFDDYDQGPGKACLDRITELVNEIVDGDFDRMDVYEAKLKELESFIDAESARDAAEHAAVAELLSGKEADLRVQQRYMQILKRELLDVDMPEFVRDFLSQIWSQVQVMALAQGGPDSPLAQRMKRAGHDLALSVQPKGSPQLRKEFLLRLPQLMKDLNEGLAMIQWSESAKQQFFAQLLPAHAAGLKAAPPHELTTRLLEQRLHQVEQISIPSREEAANDPLPSSLDQLGEAPTLTVASALSPEEVQQTGFVPEAALGAEGDLDINLDLPGEADPSLSDIDINLDIPPPPSAGLQLVHHIQKGTPYHMMMQGQWKKVRLTWVSDGRTFFIFTHGQMHKQTISLTGRTLAKMCETGRFKAFEQSELIERATVRARRQLAALRSQSRAAGAA